MTLQEILDKNLSAADSKMAHYIGFDLRIDLLVQRQSQSTSMFERLKVIINQITENCKTHSTEEEQISPKVPAFLADHNYAFSNTSSGISSASSSPPLPLSSASPSSSSSGEQENTRFKRCQKVSAKRKIIDDDQEFSVDDEDMSLPEEEQSQQYPQQVDENIILGPNGTQVDVLSYNSIIWSSAASATRQLLGFVFSSDVLATHTLTGKPSPAFYGRERPAKMQLDPIKAADIIHCVRSKFKCTEREIRAAITTKCSDTSKKYKRRHQKQLESSQVVN
ncbi:early boundary activity protein 2 [Lucilia sericata]|uniref:early boundary activity protein 2 n=1 Tax=Lucilia sericata TaxID=13632 RepID=UPI0018A834D7|nr:early boundary activity protein 2 [Lucilia sericata]